MTAASNNQALSLFVFCHEPESRLVLPRSARQDRLQEALRGLDLTFADASFEIEPTRPDGVTPSRACWGKHVIELAAFERKEMHCAQTLEAALSGSAQLGPVKIDEDARRKALEHHRVVALHYAGAEEAVLEQYVALTAVASVLTHEGGVVALNERALAAIPIEPLTELGARLLPTLRAIALPQFYCGCIALSGLEMDSEGVWLRTMGAGRFDLPNLAVLSGNSVEQCDHYFGIFASILHLMRECGPDNFGSGAIITLPGEPGQPDDFILFREPSRAELAFLQPTMMVIEAIDEHETQRLVAAQQAGE